MHFEKKDDILMELTKTAENKTENDAWLSLVERYVRDVEVAGSNPVTPIPPFRWGIFLYPILPF